LYTYQLNANVQSQWYTLDYSAYGYQVTEGVLVGDAIYFVFDKFGILKYSNSILSERYYIGSVFVAVGRSQIYSTDGKGWNNTYGALPQYIRLYGLAYGNGVFAATGRYSRMPLPPLQVYSTDKGFTWTLVTNPLSGYWLSAAFGNGVFVMVGSDGVREFDAPPGGNTQAYSTDNGLTWIPAITPPLEGEWTSVAFGNGVFVMVGFKIVDYIVVGQQAYSTDNGLTWTLVENPLTTEGTLHSVAFGNGVFVMAVENKQAYSTDNGLTWNTVENPLEGIWEGIAYGNGTFVITGLGLQAYSTDNGLTWTSVEDPIFQNVGTVGYGNDLFVTLIPDEGGYDSYQYWSDDDGRSWNPATRGLRIYASGVAASPITIPGDGLRNLIAVGNYIYCSTSNVTVQIDTTQDLLTSSAYKFPAPVLPTGQYVFANGPRYVYMFSQSDPVAKNIVRFDPYPPTPTLQTSILVDYESLPPEVPKPDKALLGLIQTQKVTDMNYMNIRGPVKELWVTGTSSTTNVFQYSNLAAQSTLALTAGEEIITEDVGTHTFLSTIEPFETHTSMPIRNVSVIPFEFDPESDIPNGTVNFSRIRDQVFNGGAETVWARTYNLLAIQGGIGGLIFNS
jgi:hypothetical protein